MINFLFVTALAVVTIYDIKEKRIPNLCVLLIAVKNAITAAVSMSLQPRNNPPAAISFTSPPPNAPLVITAIISNGVLTHRTSNIPDAKLPLPEMNLSITANGQRNGWMKEV